MTRTILAAACVSVFLIASLVPKASGLPASPTLDSSGSLNFELTSEYYFVARAPSGDVNVSYTRSGGGYGWWPLGSSVTLQRLDPFEWNLTWPTNTEIQYLFADAMLSDSVDCWWNRTRQFAASEPVALFLWVQTAWEWDTNTWGCQVTITASEPGATVAFYDNEFELVSDTSLAVFELPQGFATIAPRGPTTVTVTMEPEGGRGDVSNNTAYVALAILGAGLVTGAVFVVSRPSREGKRPRKPERARGQSAPRRRQTARWR